MLNKRKRLSYLSVALLFFAIVACAPEIPFIRYHDFQEGLDNWKCIVNGRTEQETKYNYNENGELESIEFFSAGSPYFITSYLEYVAVKDSTGHEVKYRYCSKRIHYGDNSHSKDWDEITTIVIINNEPKIKSMVTNDGSGSLKYRDEYEYDNKGRKVTATRTFENNNYTKYEYSYEDEKNLGVVTEEYYFETPRVYYNLTQYMHWCTLASEKIPMETLTSPTSIR